MRSGTRGSSRPQGAAEGHDSRSVLQSARDAALRFLAARARSVHELGVKLRASGYDEEIIEQVVEDLRRLRLLDDGVLARDFIQARLRTRPAASTRLSGELRRRGISGEIVTQALEEFGEQLDTVASAAAALRRQGWRYRELERAVAFRRMYGFLARRGYPQDVIRTAVEKVWEELSQHESE